MHNKTIQAVEEFLRERWMITGMEFSTEADEAYFHGAEAMVRMFGYDIIYREDGTVKLVKER